MGASCLLTNVFITSPTVGSTINALVQDLGYYAVNGVPSREVIIVVRFLGVLIRRWWVGSGDFRVQSDFTPSTAYEYKNMIKH